MAAATGSGGTTETGERAAPARRARRRLALTEAAGADQEPGADTPPMAVSIAGVSTACSPEALADSAEAVRRSLGDD
jgi:hypothetical protein